MSQDTDKRFFDVGDWGKAKKISETKKQKKKSFKSIIAFKDHKQEKTKTKKIYLQKKDFDKNQKYNV